MIAIMHVTEAFSRLFVCGGKRFQECKLQLCEKGLYVAMAVGDMAVGNKVR